MTIKYALTKCFVNAGHKALRESSKEGESRERERGKKRRQRDRERAREEEGGETQRVLERNRNFCSLYKNC